MKLVWDKAPDENHGRRSEGSFIRLPNGAIMFAYSEYNTGEFHDGSPCDIAAIYSYDEGENWSQPVTIIKAENFGVENIMSVSAIYQQNGEIGIYFLIKENEGNNTIGRALSKDGIIFNAERCIIDGPLSWYVMNNDRIIRLKDGRLAVSLAMHDYNSEKVYGFAVSVLATSCDDGKTFVIGVPRLTLSVLRSSARIGVDRGVGMQEPGIIEHKDGTIRLWARTATGFQYESFSRDGGESFTAPAESPFFSPTSPLEMAEYDGAIYAVYNPVPLNYYTEVHPAAWWRTPLVIQKSIDDGKTWGKLNVIENDESRGYCYPAMFFTKDNSMLLGYCRGGYDEVTPLRHLGITKIGLEEIN